MLTEAAHLHVGSRACAVHVAGVREPNEQHTNAPFRKGAVVARAVVGGEHDQLIQPCINFPAVDKRPAYILGNLAKHRRVGGVPEKSIIMIKWD